MKNLLLIFLSSTSVIIGLVGLVWVMTIYAIHIKNYPTEITYLGVVLYVCLPLSIIVTFFIWILE